MPKKILTVVGARPQFIKAAAVSRALRQTPGLREIMVHTGQHFDEMMSDVFFRELDIEPPAHHFAIHGGSHGAMTGKMLAAIEAVCIDERPDIVLVYGDTNSTIAGALAASKLHIPVAHVEAGLRSYNRRMPEEINRVLTDHLADLLLCPTRTAVSNLAREGITSGVHHVGDVMYDAALDAARRARTASTILARLDLAPKSYSLATLHRAENTDDALQLGRVFDYLGDVAERRPLVLPLHPRTRQAAARFGFGLERFRVIEPVGHFDMMQLLENAYDLHTDSGGLQKEAYFTRTPCVTLRSETEWIETVDAGWNRLWSVPEYRPRREIADFGTGHSAERIVELLR